MENLKLFYRLALKNREVYFLKIITLSIAFGSSVLILLFSINEFGYDRFHSDAGRIFRVLQRNNIENFSGIRLSNQLPADVHTNLVKDTSLTLSRVKTMSQQVIIANETIHRDITVHAVDFSLLQIFSFDFITGTGDEFKSKKEAVVISRSLAKQLFGTSDVIGNDLKLCAWNDTVSIRVAAVFDDFPSNSHETFSAFIPFNNKLVNRLGFRGESFQIYGKLHDGDIAAHDITTINQNGDVTYKLQPLTDVYFGPRIFGDNAHHGDSYSILILISITSLVFFLAVTGFINLTALTLPYRAKEIAIKKLAGNDANELLIAFAKESFTISVVSFLLGTGLLIGLSQWISPVLSINVIGLLKEGDIVLISVMISLVAIVGVAPLLVVTKFLKASPVRLLSTDTITFPRLKRVITCLQLGVSIFLIVASMVIKRQINRSLVKEPGRNYDQVVYLPYPDDMTDEDLYNLRSQWRKFNPNIVDVMATSQLPDHIQSKEVNSDFYFISVNPSFIEFFNLKMSSGNWFKANNADSAIVVNRAGSLVAGNQGKQVIGVIDNIGGEFHLAEKPLKINLATYHNYNFLCIRILEVEIRRTMKYLSETFAENGRNAHVSFLNKRFEEWLKYQDRLNSLSDILTLISALLACCSIYGLSVSLVRDKLKQIAVHKLYGAAVIHITKLLVKEFAKQLGLAILIFAPITYIVVNELLRNFVYTTHFHWLDPIIPIAYCSVVITALCGIQALSLNRSDLTSALKGS
jgi:putative ABC transport system permease protein